MTTAQRWYLRRRMPAEVPLGPDVDPVLARVLYARHIDTSAQAAAFLGDESLDANPFDLAGMNEAVERLSRALAAGERIVVYGDFDTDGVTATVLLVSVLRQLGAQVEYYVPDRFSEAYGLNNEALRYLREERHADLVVTVDCGIRSSREVAYAHSLGLDVIVTDHHSVPAMLPPALAVIDPKREDCPYPFKSLAGVGVAYRLADALFRAGVGTGGAGALENYLDLVALGTVADVVPLVEENRRLVRRGLARMAHTERPGLRALMAVAGIGAAANDSPANGRNGARSSLLDSQAIGFRLAPRLNAAGRLQHARLAYELLMCDDAGEATALAAQLDAINGERQELLERQLARAREALAAADGHALLMVDETEFHEGIVGLIASRLTDEFYRPALVMRRGSETTRGSARSIEGFHITRALEVCADLLLRYGGHERAAGFTLATANLPALRERLDAYCAEHLSEEVLRRRFQVDAIIELGLLSVETPAALARLEPFGEGNPEPALASVGLRLTELRPVGQEGRHLRLGLSDGRQTVSGIAFRLGHLAAEFARGDRVDVVYRPTINEWQGERSLQLQVAAIRPAVDGARP